jgi:hypothetical protein
VPAGSFRDLYKRADGNNNLDPDVIIANIHFKAKIIPRVGAETTQLNLGS